MKNTTWAAGVLLGVMLGSGAQAQTNTFHITLDTTGLYQTVAGDYLFDLQLNGTHGSRASISDLQWGGGSLLGTLDLSGAVTVKSPSDIVMGATDASNIYNEFTQTFNPGSEIAFDVRFDPATYNPGDQFPDLFSFGMIETTGDIASTGPNGFEYATLELPLGTNAFTAGILPFTNILR